MLTPDLKLENNLWASGYRYIAGVDEVGRGSWAGPLVAAAVILPKNFIIPRVFGDSKQLKPLDRTKLATYIRAKALSIAISEVSASQINNAGIARTTQIAFRKCIAKLEIKPNFVLVDAFYIKHFAKYKQMPVKFGDQISASIAAASVVAKVYRDSLMKRLSLKFPLYLFGKNKGYGTKDHQEAIKNIGFSKIHRTSFNLRFLL